MKPAPQKSREPDDVARAAAQWVLRSDRGLTAAEQDELSQWLAADTRHRDALAQQRWGWDELDRLAGLQTSMGALPDPDLLAPSARAKKNLARRVLLFAPLALAAGLIFMLLRPEHRAPLAPPSEIPAVPVAATALAAPCERLALEDGSVVELNRGAAVEVAFTAAERRVRLVRGEANFTVAKNPARPFVVAAGGVDVVAVGTVFNVRLDAAAIEVLVSEGRVKVAPPQAEALVGVGQRAVVARTPDARPAVETLTDAELSTRLAWRPQLLDFTNQPLAEIVAEFNRRNPVQLVLAEPAVGALRLSAQFRSDNIEGFVRLLESDFGVKAEWRGEREIALRTR